MKIVVLGLWHLGCVTAACAAKIEDVVGLDFDAGTIVNLGNGKTPIFEPGLAELIAERRKAGKLTFTADPQLACRDADLLWVCYDTPLDDNDVADVEPVLRGIRWCIPLLRQNTLILISSQIPAGTCQRLESLYPHYRFAYSPENLRLGRAISIFTKAERIILGTRNEKDAAELRPLLRNFTQDLMLVSTESAEMIKHAINSFLAMSIAFMNEIARICEAVGADAGEVEKGLKSESRIGPRAYLSPGSSFAGGTLARDVVTLAGLAKDTEESVILIPTIKTANDQHKHWAEKKLAQELGEIESKRVAVVGLTYKPGTDTLRRSLAVELCRRLVSTKAQVVAYDPVVKSLPPDLSEVSLAPSAAGALENASAVILCTEWPQFRELPWKELVPKMKQPVVIDANGFLAEAVGSLEGVIYRRVGKPKNNAN